MSKKKTKVILFMVASLLLLVIFAEADKQVSKLENKWVWTPAGGNVNNYELQKSTNGGATWETVSATIPSATVVYAGKVTELIGKEVVEYVVVSVKDEAYQIRVRGIDATGNTREWSFISEVLKIQTIPGKPIIDE